MSATPDARPHAGDRNGAGETNATALLQGEARRRFSRIGFMVDAVGRSAGQGSTAAMSRAASHSTGEPSCLNGLASASQCR